MKCLLKQDNTEAASKEYLKERDGTVRQTSTVSLLFEKLFGVAEHSTACDTSTSKFVYQVVPLLEKSENS